MFRRSLVLLLSLLLLLATSTTQAEETELEGMWEAMSCVMMGGKIECVGKILRFEGNRMYFRGADDENWTSGGTFSVNPSAMPAEIEIDNSFIMLGIYEIDDDLLRICVGFGGESEPRDRPDVFESPKGSGDLTVLIVLRGVTEEDDE